jgi:hypothetical protein
MPDWKDPPEALPVAHHCTSFADAMKKTGQEKSMQEVSFAQGH